MVKWVCRISLFDFRKMHLNLLLPLIAVHWLSLVKGDSVEASYQKFKFQPKFLNELLNVPVKTKSCCYKWCEARSACHGFIYNSRKKTCILLKDAFELSDETNPVEISVYMKKGIDLCSPDPCVQGSCTTSNPETLSVTCSCDEDHKGYFCAQG